MEKLAKQFEEERGESMKDIPINGLHMEYIRWLEAKINNSNDKARFNAMLLDVATDIQKELLTQCKKQNCDDQQTDNINENVISVFDINKQRYFDSMFKSGLDQIEAERNTNGLPSEEKCIDMAYKLSIDTSPEKVITKKEVNKELGLNEGDVLPTEFIFYEEHLIKLIRYCRGGMSMMCYEVADSMFKN
jgi:hypothetical protein